MPKTPPSHNGHRQRLRERFRRTQFQGFHDYEVVELLLTLAIPRTDVKQPAKELIRRFGTLRGILDASPEDLQAVPGLGEVAPVALKIMREVASLYLQQSAEARESLIDPEALSAFWRMRIGGLGHEVFQVAYLDSAGRVLRDGVETLEEGTIDRATIYPRRLVEAALRREAAALVLAHNHPNGDLRPSDQDKLLTRALILATETVQIRIFDHLIVSADGVFSFRKAGLL